MLLVYTSSLTLPLEARGRELKLKRTRITFSLESRH
jgi:hypothetical protein